MSAWALRGTCHYLIGYQGLMHACVPQYVVVRVSSTSSQLNHEDNEAVSSVCWKQSTPYVQDTLNQPVFFQQPLHSPASNCFQTQPIILHNPTVHQMQDIFHFHSSTQHQCACVGHSPSSMLLQLRPTSAITPWTSSTERSSWAIKSGPL